MVCISAKRPPCDWWESGSHSTGLVLNKGALGNTVAHSRSHIRPPRAPPQVVLLLDSTSLSEVEQQSQYIYSTAVFPRLVQEMTLKVSECQCTGSVSVSVSVSVCLSPPSAKKKQTKQTAQKPKRFHQCGVKAPRSFCTSTNFTGVLPWPPVSLNHRLCNRQCTKDDGYAWPAAKCSRKNPHLFSFPAR